MLLSLGMLYLKSKGTKQRSPIQGWFIVKVHHLVKSGGYMEKRDKFPMTFTRQIGIGGKILEQGFQKYPRAWKNGRTEEIWMKNSSGLSWLLLVFLAHQLRDRGSGFRHPCSMAC